MLKFTLVSFEIFCIIALITACRERLFDNAFDPESANYLGKSLSTDADSNGVADVLEPNMLKISAGCFNMGANQIFREDLDSTLIEADEMPAHEVCVDSFYMKDTEVSYGEFRSLFAERTLSAKKDKYPILNISWYDAVEYCNRLSQIHGYEEVYKIRKDVVEIDLRKKGFRLPTEAEWEWAYGYDSLQLFYWGEDSAKTGEYAWYVKNAKESSQPVASKKENANGLYDMAGNVWEWVNDYYNDSYFEDSPRMNPQGPNFGNFRVAKGGSYRFPRFSLRRSNRISLKEEDSHLDVGFRIVLPGDMDR